MWSARSKGNSGLRRLRATNPVAVGDNVLYEFDKNCNTGIITEVLDRKNYILRKASNLSKQTQVLAANIDQLFLMITIILPETPMEFIDRFLMTAEAYSVPASLIINKTDIYGEYELEKMEQVVSIYGNIGYDCYRMSLTSKTGIEAVREKMTGKINLLAGNSGVGKTTLLNVLEPSLNLKTG